MQYPLHQSIMLTGSNDPSLKSLNWIVIASAMVVSLLLTLSFCTRCPWKINLGKTIFKRRTRQAGSAPKFYDQNPYDYAVVSVERTEHGSLNDVRICPYATESLSCPGEKECVTSNADKHITFSGLASKDIQQEEIPSENICEEKLDRGKQRQAGALFLERRAVFERGSETETRVPQRKKPEINDKERSSEMETTIPQRRISQIDIPVRHAKLIENAVYSSIETETSFLSKLT